jgi:phage tail-like protein
MPQAVDTSREDPLLGFQFRLDLSDSASGYFTECSGLGSENETMEQKVVSEGGQQVVLKIPGRLKWGDITLKRGITTDLKLWEWRAQVEKGDVTKARKSGSIVMFDANMKDVARWDFINAWPSKISGPSLKADSNDIVLEELTLVHEFIERVKA